MDACDGKRHIAKGEDEGAVAMDAHDIAFGSLELTACDADQLAVAGVLADGVLHELNIPGGGLVEENEVVHLRIGYAGRLTCA